MVKSLLNHYVFVFYVLLNVACASPLLGAASILGDLLEPRFPLLSSVFRGVVFLISATIIVASIGMARLFSKSEQSFFRCFTTVWLNFWSSLPKLSLIGGLFRHRDETIPRPKDGAQE